MARIARRQELNETSPFGGGFVRFPASMWSFLFRKTIYCPFSCGKSDASVLEDETSLIQT